jgi:L,D-transpeptidase catalytic domain
MSAPTTEKHPRKLPTDWPRPSSSWRVALVFAEGAHHLPFHMDTLTRRQMMKLGITGLALAASGRALAAGFPNLVSPALLARARAALRQHQGQLRHIDRIGIVDFSRPSSAPRFFVVDVASGQSTAHLVAHGKGSDPARTGWVQRFSNVPGSNASSAGAYVTGDAYQGAHGRSMRLEGLDSVNSNVEARAIVVHAAWYVNPEMAQSAGMIGRSQGCFAMSAESRDAVMSQLGAGRLIYADKG